MRFLVDECCDAGLVDVLRGDGHSVLYATESLRGASDEELLTCAFSEDRIGELVYRLRQAAHGIVLLPFDVTDRALKIPRLRYLLEQEAERLRGAFIVLEADKVRIRPLI